MKAQHQQVKLDRRQTLTEFIKEGEVNLKHGEQYDLTDMAVTSDNKLLLCNFTSSHIYIYKDYKTYEDEIYHVMFHLVTTCVCRVNQFHICIHDLVDPQPVLGILICCIYI
jgi:hypothetical protein